LLALFAAVWLLVSAAMVAVSGVELGERLHFSQVELRLILLAVVGTALTPTLLWFFHIRKRIWTRARACWRCSAGASRRDRRRRQLWPLGAGHARGRRLLVRFLGRPDVRAWRGLDGLELALARRGLGDCRHGRLSTPTRGQLATGFRRLL